MGADALGGGVLVAAAAVLWLAYLLPTWLHRRQYVTAERNAVRLQQTLRALAETAEAPQELAVEASAREVVAQSKVLRERETAARELVKAEAAAAATARKAEDALRLEKVRAEAARVASNPVLVARKKLRLLRRVRGLIALALVGSLGAVVGGGIAAAVSGTWVVFTIGTAVGVASFLTLGSLARVSRAAARISGAAPAAATVSAPAQFTPVEFADAAHTADAETQSWTPAPLPKPAYQARGSVAAAAMSSVKAAAELRDAAARAALLQRAAALEAASAASAPAAKITRIASAPAKQAPPAPAAQSRFAAMGMVGETSAGMGDLDAVLRRRRAG